MESVRSLLFLALAGASSARCDPAPAGLPAGLRSPDRGVVCHVARGVCFDRFGPSIGLTEAFLGKAAAQSLTATLRESPPATGPEATFSPAERVECRREEGPCRAGGMVDEGLTKVIYGPWYTERDRSGEAAAAVGEWRWRHTRHANDTEARPADPARYVLRLESDGSVRIRADCNHVDGPYRLDGSRITIDTTRSTEVACGPGSLDRVFLRDLSAASIFFLREGVLFLDLKYDTGTMEFERASP